MRLRLVFDTWFVPPRRNAWVLYPFLFFRQKEADVSDELLRHELEHVYQVHRHGWLKFYCSYLWCHLRYGYADNPFEIEAREAAKTGLDDGDFALLLRWVK